MYYQINRETQKLELIFSKEEYMALPASDKAEIKSSFLFSRYVGGWVSRAKWPHTYSAERVAQRLGAENRGKTGEALTFAEQQERKADRAERRADRMDARSEKAAAEGERLQKPIEDMHGDIAFFTQPNINSSAGRAFTNRRNKMWAAWERGWDEFKKSEYYAERAETARETAKQAKATTDKGFCERRIAEAEKTIRAQKKNMDHYNEILARINKGETVTAYNGEVYTAETVNGWIENAGEIIEQAISKAVYYREALESLGGVQFSRENIKPGYMVEMRRWGVCKVVSCGPKNITFISDKWEFPLKESYAEIVRLVKAEEQAPERHPFQVGDTFTPEMWNSETHKREKVPVEIVKATDKSVTIENKANGQKWVRKPSKRTGQVYNGGQVWSVFLTDDYYSGCFKAEQAPA